MPWISTTIDAPAPRDALAQSGGLVAGADVIKPGAVAFRGAGFGEKTLSAWDATPRSADAAILPESRALSGRSSDILRNNGFAAGVQQTSVDNIIGPMGLRVSPRVDYVALGKSQDWARDWNKRVRSEFRTWATNPLECDFGGVLDFADHQTIAYKNCFAYGDSFAQPRWDDKAKGRWKTRLMGIQPSRVRNPSGQVDRVDTRGGIRFDSNGRPVSAYVARRNPDDLIGLGGAAGWYGAYESDEVPFFKSWGRRSLIHVVERGEYGQTRGVGVLAPFLAQFKQLDQYLDYEMKNQMLNSLVGMIIETPVEDLLSHFKDPAEALKYLDGRKPPTFNGGGQVLQTKVGERVTAFAPNRPGPQLEQFAMIFLRELCAGSNLPYELFTKDFSKSSYVGIRAGLAEAVRFFTSKRYWLATAFCQPVYELWLEEAVNAGRIEAPGYYDNPAAYGKAKWLGARYSFTDRVKEITASALALENDLTTYEDELSFLLGEDWEDVFEQRKIENDVRKLFGLGMVAGPATIAAAGAPQQESPPQQDGGQQNNPSGQP